MTWLPDGGDVPRRQGEGLTSAYVVSGTGAVSFNGGLIRDYGGWISWSWSYG